MFRGSNRKSTWTFSTSRHNASYASRRALIMSAWLESRRDSRHWRYPTYAATNAPVSPMMATTICVNPSGTGSTPTQILLDRTGQVTRDRGPDAASDERHIADLLAGPHSYVVPRKGCGFESRALRSSKLRGPSFLRSETAIVATVH